MRVPDVLDERLQAFAAMGRAGGVFSDFDGSLAPIIEDPERAEAVRGTDDALEALAARFGVVAVISGRPVSFLATHVRARGVRLAGLYGIEERTDDDVTVHPEALAARASVDRLVERLHDSLGEIPGIYIEHKGYSAAVHYRRATDPEAAAAHAGPIVLALAKELRLEKVVPGKQVLEVAPAVPVDKGAVVRRFIESHGLRAALVAGDDRGDIAMFEAAAACELPVRVAVESKEAPAALLALADVRVESPQRLVELLTALAVAARP